MSVARAESLVFELHGALLRLVSNRAGCHYQGLSAASRHLKSLGRIDNRTSKKLIRIDDAFNVVRHITSVSVDMFTADLTKMLDMSIGNCVQEEAGDGYQQCSATDAGKTSHEGCSQSEMLNDAAAPRTELGSDESDEDRGEGEEVEPLPDAEQHRDRLLNAPVKRRSAHGHVVFSGVIDEIGVGTRTAQRLYRVLFDDGDMEHITQKEAAASWVATL